MADFQRNGQTKIRRSTEITLKIQYRDIELPLPAQAGVDDVIIEKVSLFSNGKHLHSTVKLPYPRKRPVKKTG